MSRAGAGHFDSALARVGEKLVWGVQRLYSFK
jgi:hypothetical protein